MGPWRSVKRGGNTKPATRSHSQGAGEDALLRDPPQNTQPQNPTTTPTTIPSYKTDHKTKIKNRQQPAQAEMRFAALVPEQFAREKLESARAREAAAHDEPKHDEL